MGRAGAFKSCETIESDWFGPLSTTVEWMLSSAALLDKDAERVRHVVEEVRRLDELVSHDELRPTASGVHIVVRKPASS